MDTTKIRLKVGESMDLFIPSKGAVPILLEFEIKPKEIAELVRKELIKEKQPKDLKPGDPLPKYFELTAKSKGEAEVEFFEQPIGAPKSNRTSVEKYFIIVE